MPAKQRGFARKRPTGWLAVWREDGRERSRGGFETKTAALDYANGKAEQADALRNAIRYGDRLPAATEPIGTVSELVEAFLARHRVDEATRKKLRAQLKHATRAFGERPLETLQPIELDVWRSQLPALSAHYIFRAIRQVLEYAVSMQLIESNPTARIRNTRAAVRREMSPFESWEQLEAIAAEMDPRFAAIPIVLVGTGLRPEELWALERRDVDLDEGVLSIERVYSGGTLKTPAKSSRQRRRVPLRERVVAACGRFPRGSTRRFSSLPRGAATSTARSSATATGHLRCEPRGSSTAAFTTAGTRSPPGRSRAGCSSSIWLASWERAWRRSTLPTGTRCRTVRTICAACSTITTPRSRQKEGREHACELRPDSQV